MTVQGKAPLASVYLQGFVTPDRQCMTVYAVLIFLLRRDWSPLLVCIHVLIQQMLVAEHREHWKEDFADAKVTSVQVLCLQAGRTSGACKRPSMLGSSAMPWSWLQRMWTTWLRSTLSTSACTCRTQNTWQRRYRYT